MYRVKYHKEILKTYYILLASGTSEVTYSESEGMRTWEFFNFSGRTCFYQYRCPGRGREELFQIVRKPLSFLDSISYYDQKWLLEEHLLAEFFRPDTFIYILDKNTIKNDSISMYQVMYDAELEE